MGLIFRLGFASLGIGTILFLWLDLTVKFFALLDLCPGLEKMGIESALICLLRLNFQTIQTRLDHTPIDTTCFALFPVFCLLGFVVVFCVLAIWQWNHENG